MIARSFLNAAGAIAISAAIGFPALAQESSDPIKIALFDWTSVNLNAKIFGGILEKLGYTVEYPTADYLSSLTTGLTNGDLTVGSGILGHDGRRGHGGLRRHGADGASRRARSEGERGVVVSRST